jgi:hypothetical protein
VTAGAASDGAAPRYGRASLAEVVPSALAALGLADDNPLHLADAAAVIVLVVDGLGARQLAAHADAAPFLVGRDGPVVDAGFPSTTAVSLTSIGTGLPPGQHGVTSYAIAYGDHEQPLNLLTWNIGLRGGGFDAREAVVPERFQPRPTAFERAAALGAGVTVVVHPHFTTSGLTRAGLRGGTRREADGLAATLETAVAATRGSGPTLVYAHHGDVDTMGHVYGPGSEPWLAALATVDAAVTDTARRLPPGVTLVVTADHGMVDVPDDDVFELSEVAALADGVRLLAGEPRCRQLWVRDGAHDEVLAAWRETLAGRAEVVTRDEAVAAGWFGPVADDLAGRIGDVLAVATAGSMAHREVDPLEGRLRGQHGALSRDEMEVPLITIGGGT